MLRARLITLLLVLTFLSQLVMTPLEAARSTHDLPLATYQLPAMLRGRSVSQLGQFFHMGVSQYQHSSMPSKQPPPISVTTDSSKIHADVSLPATGGAAPDSPTTYRIKDVDETLGGCNPSNGGICRQEGSYPVTLPTGNFWHTFDDLSVPGRGPALHFMRTYNSLPASFNLPAGPLGSPGWTHTYNMDVQWFCENGPACNSYHYVVDQENGSTVLFDHSGTTYSPRNGAHATLISDTSGVLIFTRTQSQEKFIFSCNMNSGGVCSSTGDPVAGKLLKIVDHNNYTTTLSYTTTGTLAGFLNIVTDPAGRSLQMSYSQYGGIWVLTRVQDAIGRHVDFTYDSNHDLRMAADVAGKVSSFTYDSSHHILTMTDPRNGTVTNTYGVGDGMVVQQTDPLSHTLTFDYRQESCFSNFDRTIATSTTTLGFTSVYTTACAEYAGDHRILQATYNPNQPDAATWTYHFDDPAHPWDRTGTQDPLGHVYTATYDTKGNLLTSTDPLNRTTSFAYNTLNQPLVITDARQIPITYTYDIRGNLTSITRPITETGQTITSTFGYDPARPGDVLTATNTLGNKWLFAYNANGYITSSTNPLAATTVYTPDNIGRLLNIRLPSDITPTVFTYNAWGAPTRITDTLGYTTVYTYDGNRNLTNVADPNRRVTTYTYDLANQLNRITQPDGTHSDYGYDADGNVIAQTNALTQTTHYSYDVFERLISSTDPLTRTTVYTYDLASRLTALEDPLARRTTYGYDPANQLTGITYSDGTTPNVAFGYNAVGQRTVMTDGIGTTDYTYDSLGRLTEVQQGNARTVQYQYDLASRLWKLTYPNFGSTGVLTVTHGYDAANRLTSVTDWLTNLTQFGYDPKGNLTSIAYPNGVQARLGYDAANQVITTTQAVTTTPFLSLTYTLDPAGLLASAGEQRGTAVRDQHGYTYDPLNRLTGDDLSVSQTISRTWSYDGATEITQTTYRLNGGDPTISTRTYDAANELKTLIERGSDGPATKDLSFSYDADGNRTQQVNHLTSSTTNYSYDQADRLIDFANGLVEKTYSYNGDGLRLQKTNAGIGLPQTIDYTWDVGAGLPLLLQDNTASYIYGPGGLLIEQITAGGTPYYYHTDRLGSVRALTNGSGTVVNTTDYDAYGQPTSTSGSVANPFGYAGEYTDSETGFLYLRARYYDPATQQFLTVDPLLAATAQAYNYAGGNPLNATDPSGRRWSVEGGGTGGDFAGAQGAYGGGGYIPLDLIIKGIIVTSGAYAVYQTIQAGQQCAVALQNWWNSKQATTVAMKGEYIPPGLSGDKRYKYRQAIHRYKKDLPSDFKIPRYIADAIADAIKNGSSAIEAADNAPALPGVDYDDPENPPDWSEGH
jgi:RHS repeat-associated protein